MQCPICQHPEEQQVQLHSEGFHEGIYECHSCGAVWSVNHDLAEIVKDPQEFSFLSVLAEPVDGGNYCLVG